jgi:hypothetical protein
MCDGFARETILYFDGAIQPRRKVQMITALFVIAALAHHSFDQVTIDGYVAKDGSKTCNARSVKLPDGRSVFAGSSAGDAPTPVNKR